MGLSMGGKRTELRGVLLAASLVVAALLTFYTGLWIVAPADTIVSATVTGVKNHGLGKGGGPRLFYRYELGGNIYTSSGEIPTTTLDASGGLPYRKGDIIEVYVSRPHPAVSFVKKPDPFEWSAASAVLLLAAVVVHTYGRRDGGKPVRRVMD